MGQQQESTLSVSYDKIKKPLCKPRCKRVKPRACSVVYKGERKTEGRRLATPSPSPEMESWMDKLSMYNQSKASKTIENITLGENTIKTWYRSAYPARSVSKSGNVVICETCLGYMPSTSDLLSHKCSLSHPPGARVYKEDHLVVFRVDGAVEETYCQNLCLMAKLFMEQKTLYFDVEPFLFYVFCQVDDNGCYHPVGYFSKEKECEKYNLSCIVVLPPYQRFGYGKLMISLSYEISILEGKTGSPEKPLSSLGQKSYMAYWKTTVLRHLVENSGKQLSMVELSKRTGICESDVLETLVELRILKSQRSSKVDARHSVAKSYLVSILKDCKKFRSVDPSLIKIM